MGRFPGAPPPPHSKVVRRPPALDRGSSFKEATKAFDFNKSDDYISSSDDPLSRFPTLEAIREKRAEKIEAEHAKEKEQLQATISEHEKRAEETEAQHAKEKEQLQAAHAKEVAQLRAQVVWHMEELRIAKDLCGRQTKELAETKAQKEQYKTGVDVVLEMADKLRLCCSSQLGREAPERLKASSSELGVDGKASLTDSAAPALASRTTVAGH